MGIDRDPVMMIEIVGFEYDDSWEIVEALTEHDFGWWEPSP